MHPLLRERFSAEARDHAAMFFGASPDDLEELSGFENFVFGFEDENEDDCVLRISHSVRRTEAHTRAEIAWVADLAAREIPVSRPLPSVQGKWVERIPDGRGSYFVASAFRRAPGVVLADAPALRERLFDTALFEQWGEIVARMHAHAAGWEPPRGTARRSHWHEYDVVAAERFVPADEHVIVERARELVARLARHSTDAQSYGLIHADLTDRNFCVDDGKMTIFDFDNAEYAWFVKDIAVVVYYVARSAEPDRRETFAADFLSAFLAGYRRVRDPGSLEMLPDLLALQRIMNYVLAHQVADGVDLSEEARARGASFRDEITRRSPVVDLDFTRF